MRHISSYPNQPLRLHIKYISLRALSKLSSEIRKLSQKGQLPSNTLFKPYDIVRIFRTIKCRRNRFCSLCTIVRLDLKMTQVFSPRGCYYIYVVSHHVPCNAGRSAIYKDQAIILLCSIVYLNKRILFSPSWWITMISSNRWPNKVSRNKRSLIFGSTFPPAFLIMMASSI